MPPCSAMPFMAAAMPCSRTPKWMKRPEKSAAVIAFIDLVRVLLEPVRSAEPPIISGTAGTSASSANSEAERVAMSFGVDGERLLERGNRAGERLRRQVAAHAALEFGALGGIERGQALVPVGVRRLAALPGRAPLAKHIGRHLERRVRPRRDCRARP